MFLSIFRFPLKELVCLCCHLNVNFEFSLTDIWFIILSMIKQILRLVSVELEYIPNRVVVISVGHKE